MHPIFFLGIGENLDFNLNAELKLPNLRHSGTQRKSLLQMQTRSEFEDLLDYLDWKQRDQAYFDQPSE